MSVVVRGVKNAFRNWLRSVAVVLILAIGIGLSLSMLVARQAVESKVADLKSQVGTTLIVNAAGSQGFEGGGEPLTSADVTSIQSVAHVASAEATMNFVLRNQSSDLPPGAVIRGGPSNNQGMTNLQSSIDPGTLGRRFATNDGQNAPANFSLPIRGFGTSGTKDTQGQDIKITQGRLFQNGDNNVALVGTNLATKNNLSVGSTFTAYNTTLTVVGIFDEGTAFANDTVILPLAEAQNISGQSGQINAVVVNVDSIDNLDSTSTAIKGKLGASRVDITSNEQNIQTAISSLQSVEQISLIGFIAALVAAAVIIFLVMLVIVRERRREIGVLKAIGGSNLTIVSQFMVEAIILVAISALVGFGVALVSSNGIANALVSNSTSSSQNSTTTRTTPGRGLGRGGGFFVNGASLKNTSNLVGQVTANIGPLTILWGALATLGIAIVGSAVPAWLISKVRPAIVLRGE